MTDRDKVFAGSIPELYDTWLVPLIFEPFALDLARRVAADATRPGSGDGGRQRGRDRALAPLLGPSARYVVSDLNPPMLDRAASRQGPDERITWRQADALDLPFTDTASMPCAASSARCSFPTGSPAIGKPAASSTPAVFLLQCLGPDRGQRLCPMS